MDTGTNYDVILINHNHTALSQKNALRHTHTHIMHTRTHSEIMITAKALLGMIYGDFDCGYVCVVY